MSRSVLFASGKGGTGKSSLCLHVAGALARRGLRVLVVEATPGFRGLEIALEKPSMTSPMLWRAVAAWGTPFWFTRRPSSV